MKLKGLMCIPPTGGEAAIYFKKLAKLASKHSKILERQNDPLLCSMGMSNDYKIALDEGADLVRIGSQIFGKR